MLEAPWWQGLAGMAQIFAAILTVITVLQAKKMLVQAEDARKSSADPDWDVTSSMSLSGGPTATNPEWLQAEITLMNTGFGPARMVEAEFSPKNGNKYRSISGQGQLPNSRLVPPGDVYTVRLQWDIAAPLEGTLTLKCKTRFGSLTRRFSVRTFLDEGRRGRCVVESVDQ